MTLGGQKGVLLAAKKAVEATLVEAVRDGREGEPETLERGSAYLPAFRLITESVGPSNLHQVGLAYVYRRNY